MTDVSQDEIAIMEIYAPPMAYVELPIMTDDIGMQPARTLAAVIRVVHQVVEVQGPVTKVKQVQEMHQAMLNRVRDELAAAARAAGMEQAVLWWRTRPREMEQDGKVKWYARCGTMPALPEAFWSAMAGNMLDAHGVLQVSAARRRVVARDVEEARSEVV